MEVKYVCRRCGKMAVKYRTNSRRTPKEWNYIDDKGMRVHGQRCFSCTLSDQRKARAEKGNAITRRYEKTKRGFLMRLYRNMKSRIEGVQRLKAHLYLGKDLLAKEGFYEWAEASPDFHRLYEAYERSDFDRELAPSVDRIDTTMGYILGNMRWITANENSRLGIKNLHRPGRKYARHKLTVAQVEEIVARRRGGEIARTIAKDFGICLEHVYHLEKTTRTE
jgi:hypothetical protein